MYNGLARVAHTIPMGLATARGLGTGSWIGCLVVEKVSWDMLLRIWKRIRASDTDSGEEEWFGQGMVHMRLWYAGRDPGLDWAWWLGNVLGKELVSGVQGLGHGIREL